MFTNLDPSAAYQEIDRHGNIEDASPHKLVELLYDTAIERLNQAMGALERNDMAAKGASIGKAISIIEELRRTLDMEQGGEVAETLHALYEYMKERLLTANLTNDAEILQECKGHIETLLDGWRQIPGDIQQEFANRQRSAPEAGIMTAGR